MFIFTGCATDQAHRYYLTEKLPSKSLEQVEILWAPPSRPYILVADYQSRGESAADMQKRAAADGADAVVVTLIGGSFVYITQDRPNPNPVSTFSRITGSAIIYKK